MRSVVLLQGPDQILIGLAVDTKGSPLLQEVKHLRQIG
jgi:hypothetical protein